jgi:TolA-binding protein
VRRSLRSFALLALIGCLGQAPQLAQAGLFDDEEARARVEALRKQMSEVTVSLENLNRNQLNFANQTESLRADLAKLRGQLEVLSYEIETAQKRQRDFYIDLDNRVRKLETAPPPVAEVVKPDDGAETRAYESALSALKDLKYKEAAEQMGAFIISFPSSAQSASAHFFGGYANAQVKNHAKAAELFGKFASTWPADERVPSALESQVASLETLKDSKGVNAALTVLATQYGNSEAGKRAQQRLKKK